MAGGERKLKCACPEEAGAQQCCKLSSIHSAGLKMLFGMRQSARNARCCFRTAKGNYCGSCSSCRKWGNYLKDSWRIVFIHSPGACLRERGVVGCRW